MITKWICIPYGIIIIVIAGFAKSVIPDYLSSYSMWYSSYEDYSILEYALIIGIYGGIFTGLLADSLSHRVTLSFAALLSIVSYWLIPQFDGSSRTNQQGWHFYVLVGLVFLVGQSVSLALISTIKVWILNFSITAAPIILSILLSYWFICIHVESAIRWSFFYGVDTKVYMIGVGIATSCIYAIGAIILSVEEGPQIQNGVSHYHLASLDKVCLTMFVVLEIFMILLFLMFKLITHEVVFATWTIIALLCLNFMLPILNTEWVLNRASDLLRGFEPEVDELHRMQRGQDKQLFKSLKSLKLFILLIAMVILIGAGGEIYERLSKISIAISMSFLAEYAMIWFIFGNFVTRCLIGLLYTLLNLDNDFTYTLFFSIEVLIAVILIILTPVHSVIILDAACLLAGSGVGGLSVMVPLVIVQDYGKKHLGVIWGIFTIAIEFGIWIFSMIVFDHFYGKYNKDRWGRWTKTEWFFTAFILTGIFVLIGVLLVGAVWYIDKDDSEEGTKLRYKMEEFGDQETKDNVTKSIGIK